MTESSQDPRVHELMRALNDEDHTLMEIESLIGSDERSGRLPRAEAEMDRQGARDAHLAACRRLREQFERGELGTDDTTQGTS